MNEEQLKFVRTLYGKYGMQLDPEREAKVLDAFSRDFDGSLSVFYSKYNPEKQVTPDFINSVKGKSGFIQTMQEEQLQPESFGSDASFIDMASRTGGNLIPQIKTAWADLAGWLAGGEAKMSQALDAPSREEGIVGSVAKAAKAFVDWRPFAEEGIETSEDWIRQLIEKRNEYESQMKETVTVDDFLKRKDLSSLAALAIDGAAGFIPSLTVGIPTGGAGFVPMFAGSAYMDALKEKSEVTDQDMIELVRNGQADWFVPTMVGAIAGSLERYGLSKVGGYMAGRLSGKVGKEAIEAANKTIKENTKKLSTLKGDAKKEALKEISKAKGVIESSKTFLASSAENVTRQSFINWTEHGLHEFAKEHGRSGDLDKAQERMVDAMFSKEGRDAFVTAGLGTLLMGGVSKGAGASIKTLTNKKEVVEEKASEKEEETNSKINEIKVKADEVAEVTDPSLAQEIDSIIGQYKAETVKEESKAEAEKEVNVEAEKAEANQIKESKENEKIEDQKLVEVAKGVKDASTLQSAVYAFFGIDNTNQANVEKVSTISNMIDRIVEARARRAGIKKADWYRSRIESIGRVGEKEEGEQRGSMTNFLSDGRAVIRAIEAPDARGFFREFGKVLKRDLTAEESAALSEEFGINFAEVNEESETLFIEAFESYLERGEMPSSIKGARLDLIQKAFNKLSEWIQDLKSAIHGQGFYINKSTQSIFDAIVSGTEIRKEDAQTRTEETIVGDVQSDTTVTGAGEQTDVATAKTEEGVIDLTETQEEVQVEGELTELEKAQRNLESVEKTRNRNANHPKFNVGQKYDTGHIVDVRDFKDERKDKSKDGVEVITRVFKPAEVDENDVITSRAEIEVTRFDSIDQANEFISNQYNKYKNLALQRIEKAKNQTTTNELQQTEQNQQSKQESVKEKPKKITKQEKIEDEQKTEKRTGKGTEQDSKTVTEDGKTTERAKEEPQGKRTFTKQEATGLADQLINSIPTTERFGSGKIKKASKSLLTKFIESAREVIDSENTPDKRKSLLKREVERVEKELAQNEILEKRIEDVAKRTESKLDELKKQGLSKTQVKQFLAKHGDKEILSFEDGDITFSDSYGDIGIYSVKEDKIYEGAKADKRRLDKASDKLKREKAEAIERAKTEEEKAAKAKESDNREKAETSFTYLIKKETSGSRNGIVSALKRVLSPDYNEIDFSKASFTKNEYVNNLIDIITRYLQSSTKAGQASSLLKSSYNDVSKLITSVMEKEGLFTEEQKLEISKQMTIAEGRINNVQEVKESKETKKAEKLPPHVQGTIADPSARTVSYFGKKTRFIEFIQRFHDLFNMDNKIMIVDLAEIDTLSDAYKNQTQEQRDEALEKFRANLTDVMTRAIAGVKDSELESEYDSASVESIRRAVKEDVDFVIDGTTKGKSVGGRLHRSDLAYDLITFSSARKVTQAANTLAHEYAHTLEDSLLRKQDKATIDSIENEYEEWKKNKLSELSRERQAGFKFNDLFKFRSPLGAINNILHLKEGTVKPSKKYESNEVADAFNYSITFSEYWADQVSHWMITSEQANTKAGKFFKEIAKAVKKIFESLQFNYETPQTLKKFLEDHTLVIKKEAVKNLARERESIKNAAVQSISELNDAKRKRLDIMNEAEEVKKPISMNKTPSDAEIKSMALALKLKKQDIAKRLESINNKIEKLEKSVEDAYTSFIKFGGKISKEGFMSEVSAKAKEVRAEKIRKIANKAIYEGPVEDFDGGSSIYNFMNKPNNRLTLLEKIGKSIDGKFTGKKDFMVIIDSINDSLQRNGLPKLTTKEVKDVFDSTKSGVIAQIRFPILARYTGIGKKRGMARPTESLKNILDSMNADATERAEAQKEIHDIIESYLGRSPLQDKNYGKLSYAKKKLRKGMSKLTGTSKKIVSRATAEDIARIAELELVGIANAPVSEMRRVLNEGYVKEVLTGERSKIAANILKLKNETSVQADTAIMEDVFGAKLDKSTGEYSVSLDGKSKPVKFKVFDVNKTFKKGEMILHLGKFYEAIEDTITGEAFSVKNFKFSSNVNVHQSKAAMDKKTFARKTMELVRDMFLSSHGIESLVARISRDSNESFMEGKMSKAIGEDGFRVAGKRSRDLFYEMESGFINIVKDAFGTKTEKQARRKLVEARTTTKKFTFTDNNGNKRTVEMYISELMDMYAALRQPDIRKRLDAIAKKNIDSRDIRFWNASKEAALLDALPAEYKTVVERVSSDLMPRMHAEMNKTHKAINGYDLISLPNYFPVTSGSKGLKTTELSLETADVSEFLSSVSNKNLKDRSNGALLQPEDFVMKFFNYVSRGAHYTHYAKPMSLASKMFEQNDYYRGALETAFGGTVMEQISWNLKNIAANGAANFQRNQVIDIMRGMSISGAFMANITMIPKQLSSFAAYASYMPATRWAMYYTKTATSPTEVIRDIKEILNTNFIKERLQQSGKTSLDTLNLQLDKMSAEAGKSDVRKKAEEYHAMISEWLFKPVAWGDVGAILSGGAPYWNYLKEEAAKQFPNDKAKQQEWVEVKFEESTSRTQQSRAMMDASKWQTMSSVASLFTTFMSTPILYGRILSGGIRDMNKGMSLIGKDNKAAKKLLSDGAKRFTLFGFVLPMLFQGAATGLNVFEDDDDDKKSLLRTTMAYSAISMFQHVPILYPLLQNSVDRLYLDKTFDPSVAAPITIQQDAVLAAQKMLARAVDDGDIEWDDQSVLKDIDKIAKALGFNSAMVRNLYDAWSDPLSTAGEDIRLLMGYSPYAIGLTSPGEQRSKIK